MKNINIFSFAGKMLTGLFVLGAMFSISNTVFAAATDTIVLNDVTSGLNPTCNSICIFSTSSTPLDLSNTAYFIDSTGATSTTIDMSSSTVDLSFVRVFDIMYSATDTSATPTQLIPVHRTISVVDPNAELAFASSSIVNSVQTLVNNTFVTFPLASSTINLPGNVSSGTNKGTTNISWSSSSTLVNIAGNVATINFPALGSSPATTTLTATLTYESSSFSTSTSFLVTINPQHPSTNTDLASSNINQFRVSTSTNVIIASGLGVQTSSVSINSLETNISLDGQFINTLVNSDCSKQNPTNPCVSLVTSSTSTISVGDIVNVTAQDGITTQSYRVISDGNTDIYSINIDPTRPAFVASTTSGTSTFLFVLPNTFATSSLSRINPVITPLDPSAIVIQKTPFDVVDSVNNPIEYIVTNNGTSTTYDVIVMIDNTAPTITLNGSGSVNLYSGDSYNEAGATAIDTNLFDTRSVSVAISGSVDTSTPGVYTVTYTATDLAVNTATATRTVNVIHRNGGHGPVITTTGTGSGITTTVTTTTTSVSTVATSTSIKIATSTKEIAVKKPTLKLAKKTTEKVIVFNTASSTVIVSNATTTSSSSTDASNTLTANALGATPYNPTSTRNIIIDIIGLGVIAAIIVKSFGLIK